MAEQKQGMSCPITGNNLVKVLILMIAGFIFITGYNYVVHGQILKATYDLTPQMWRTATESQEHFPYMLALFAVIAFATADIYGRFAKRNGLGEGLRYGILLGLIIGSLQALPYSWLPITWELAQAWFLAGFGEGLGIGLVYGILWRARA